MKDKLSYLLLFINKEKATFHASLTHVQTLSPVKTRPFYAKESFALKVGIF